jgi:uncharacterized protein with NRDE domain
MCILFIAVKQHPQYPLIIAANRDEFFNRPTRFSEFWSEYPDLLAGKDIEAGGTWMGVNKKGYIAALTNIRDPKRNQADAITRGKLPFDYLTSEKTDDETIQQLTETRNQFNGYNLLFGTWQDLKVYNNHLDQVRHLSDGVYGLSNADLNSNWPKINLGVRALESYCQQSQILDVDKLFTLLKDTTQPDDDALPQTGVPLEWERHISSIFIPGSHYGTRSSTLLTLDQEQQLYWQERSFNEQSEQIDKREFTFLLA